MKYRSQIRGGGQKNLQVFFTWEYWGGRTGYSVIT